MVDALRTATARAPVSLLVAIHNVAPPFERQARELWALCFASGVRPALVVVPPWLGDWPSLQHGRFTNWLFACADQGARILLRGDGHAESAWTHSRGERHQLGRRTGHHGEHLTLSYEKAREGLARGIRSLHACGLTPTGFVPIDLRARVELRRAVRDQGLALTEDSRFIWRLADETPIAAPVVRWHAGATRVKPLASATPDERWPLRRRAAFTRLVLDPGDFGDASGRATLERTLRRWQAEGGVGTYGELVRMPSRASRVAA